MVDIINTLTFTMATQVATRDLEIALMRIYASLVVAGRTEEQARDYVADLMSRRRADIVAQNPDAMAAFEDTVQAFRDFAERQESPGVSPPGAGLGHSPADCAECDITDCPDHPNKKEVLALPN